GSVRRGGIGETRPAAFGCLGGDGEVTYEKDAALGLLDIEVEVFIGVAEYTQAYQLACNPFKVSIGIGSFNGGQHEHARANLPNDAIGDVNRGLQNALNHG